MDHHDHKKKISFFLIDAEGRRHLAATAIDAGDAHYTYKSQPEFHPLYGELIGRTRKDMQLW